MLEHHSPRFKVGTIIKIAAILTVFCYIIFHIVYGDRGVISLLQYNKKYQKALSELELTKIERQKLQNKVELLKTDSIDVDLLEEQAKKSLSVTKENETIIDEENLSAAPTAP